MADRTPRRLSVLGKQHHCLVCDGETFYSREIKMQTTGMTFFNLDAFNESGEGVVCSTCGFVHTFAGVGAREWLDPGDPVGEEPRPWRNLSGGDDGFRDLSS